MIPEKRFCGGGNMLEINKRKIGVLYFLSFVLISIGVIAGTVYYSYNFIRTADVKNYLDSYVNSVKNGMDMTILIKSSIKSYSILFVLIIISAFIKFGPRVTAFILLRKGFISAFTTAAMIDVYGVGGVILSLASCVRIIVFMPVLALFVSVTTYFTKNRADFNKKEKIIYIIFSVMIFTIFCACAFIESFMTTTFMKWIAFKVT